MVFCVQTKLGFIHPGLSFMTELQRKLSLFWSIHRIEMFENENLFLPAGVLKKSFAFLCMERDITCLLWYFYSLSAHSDCKWRSITCKDCIYQVVPFSLLMIILDHPVFLVTISSFTFHWFLIPQFSFRNLVAESCLMIHSLSNSIICLYWYQTHCWGMLLPVHDDLNVTVSILQIN